MYHRWRLPKWALMRVSHSSRSPYWRSGLRLKGGCNARFACARRVVKKVSRCQVDRALAVRGHGPFAYVRPVRPPSCPNAIGRATSMNSSQVPFEGEPRFREVTMLSSDQLTTPALSQGKSNSTAQRLPRTGRCTGAMNSACLRVGRHWSRPFQVVRHSPR